MAKHLLCFSAVLATLLTSTSRLEQLLYERLVYETYARLVYETSRMLSYMSPFASGHRRQTDRLEVGDRLVNHVGRKATDLVADGVFQLLGRTWITDIHTVLEKAPQEEIYMAEVGRVGSSFHCAFQADVAARKVVLQPFQRPFGGSKGLKEWF